MSQWEVEWSPQADPGRRMQLKGQTSEFGAKEKFGRKVFKERWVWKREVEVRRTQGGKEARRRRRLQDER